MTAVTCPRHPQGDGPRWCQDCHGVHDIGRPEPDDSLRREPPSGQKPRAVSASERAEMQRSLREVLGLLRRARDEHADWYAWVLERRDRGDA